MLAGFAFGRPLSLTQHRSWLARRQRSDLDGTYSIPYVSENSLDLAVPHLNPDNARGALLMTAFLYTASRFCVLVSYPKNQSRRVLRPSVGSSSCWRYRDACRYVRSRWCAGPIGQHRPSGPVLSVLTLAPVVRSTSGSFSRPLDFGSVSYSVLSRRTEYFDTRSCRTANRFRADGNGVVRYILVLGSSRCSILSILLSDITSFCI